MNEMFENPENKYKAKKPKKRIKTLLIALILFSLTTFNSVLSISNVTVGSNVVINPKFYESCIDDNNMNFYAVWQTCEDSYNGTLLCVNYAYTQPMFCKYGCDNVTNSCKQPPYVIDMYIIGAILILAVIITWVLRR